MKSIYKVILGMWISILSFSALAVGVAVAPAALVPAGLNPGDQFYVMFVSSALASDGVTSNKKRGDLVATAYDDWVNADADLANIGPVNGLTWSALMNHEDSGGTTVQQTTNLFAANTAAPIYTTAGGKIASNRADLFDGTIATGIRFEANGTTAVSVSDTAWTGSDAAGVANFPLGNNGATTATEGLASEDSANNINGRWIDDSTPAAITGVNRIYAVSPLLVVPGPIAVNDVATVTVNASVDIDVLANDVDGSSAIDVSTVALQSQPANGSVNVNAISGLLTYLPNADYVGSDSFTYLVKDINDVDSNIATVSITVTAAASSGGGGGAMGWSLLMLFSVLSLLRAKVRK